MLRLYQIMKAATPMLATTMKINKPIQARFFFIGAGDGSTGQVASSMPLALFEGVRGLTLGNHDDVIFRHRKASATVMVQIVADHRVTGNFHIFVNDGSANARPTANINSC